MKISSSLNVLWTGDHGRTLNDLAFDGTNLWVAGGHTTPLVDATPCTRKLSLAGAVVWSVGQITNSALIQSVDADSSGNIITGFVNSGFEDTLQKLDPSGSLIWAVKFGNPVASVQGASAVAFASGGTVYAVGDENSGTLRIKQFNTSGVLMWTRPATGDGLAGGVATNSSTVTAVGARTPTPDLKTTRQYDASGSLLWAADHGASVRGVAYGSGGSVVTVGDVSSGATTRKYDSGGSLLWSVNHGDTVRCVYVDAADDVYTGGDRSGGYTTRKYDSSGSLLWSYDYNLGTTGIFTGVRGISADASGNVYMCGTRITV